MKSKTSLNSMIMDQWQTGPVSDHVLEPGHGRGIFCMSIQGDSLVTGSADHGLRQYQLNSLSYRRELFAKKYGHHEWVTSCAHLTDGRILSAGMDSALCLWESGIVQCDTILSHQASISQVLVDDNNIGISASYDCTLMIWDLQMKSEACTLFGPHKDAVLDFVWHNSLVVSGDQNGTVAFWDINTGTAFQTLKAHQGAVSQIHLYSDGMNHNYIVTAGVNDGFVCFHDMRTNKMVFNEQIHRGAINGLDSNLSSQIVTGSADKTIKLIDVLGGFQTMGTMKASDAVYCLQTIYSMTIAGLGDGNIICFDNDTGQTLYGFGAMSKGVVRVMDITEDKSQLVICGDDFSPIVLKYTK